MIRQNVETRQELEKKLRDGCKEAEDLALQRAEELLAPQMRSMGERIQGLIQAVQLRAEEAFPKIAEISDQLSATRAEVQPLHQRADAAAARLDRVAVETSTTSKDCQDLCQDFKSVVTHLREKIHEETRKREAMEESFKVALAEATRTAAAATQAAQERSDEQAREMLAKMTALEERLSARLDDTAQRNLKEMKLGDEDVVNRLRPEIQAVNLNVQKRLEEGQESAEGNVRNAVALLRTELDDSAKRVTNAGQRNVEQKVRDLIARMNEGFETAKRHSEIVREGCGAALHEATSVLRKAVNENRSSLTGEVHALRAQTTTMETRISQATSEAELKAVDASTRRLQDTATDIRKELTQTKTSLLDADENLRQNFNDILEQAVLKLERNVQETAATTSGSGSLSLGQAVTQLQSELADTLKAANEKADQIRCQAADALAKEVQARREALVASETAREALGANVREEMRNASNQAIAQSTASTDKVDRRVVAANESIKSLDRSLQAMSKEHADTTASLRNQLKMERQRTEEMGAEASTFATQVRDNIEAHLQNESTELRAALAEARKKVYEEANALRAELREQPTKRELVELASTTTEQYNELNKAIDGHRSRLEAAVSDSGTRVREARSEASEARLRMQRETMALGTELANLRAASSSLANGVLKSLQVIGFVREEVEVASGKEKAYAAEGADGAAKDHQRGIEIEDLLEWEKVGKSLATRIARQWYLKESAGIPTVLSLVERKADSEELVVLQTLMRECSPGNWNAKLNETGSTMAPFSPTSPKVASESPPSAVTKVRGQRMMAN